MTKTVYMFAGQGSQTRGMGRELFDAYPDWVEEADRILGYSIRELCLEDPLARLNQTQYTQPALYTMNALAWRKAVEGQGRRPDIVLGHSLGEYNALLAAGAFDFATGLRLVQQRGEFMGRATRGAMTAVVGLDLATIDSVFARADLDAVDIANVNSPSQVVLSGDPQQLERAGRYMKEAGASMVMPLKVSAAFHSRLMAPLAREFAAVLRTVAFRPLTCRVIANCTAQPYDDGSVRALLAAQFDHSVLWLDSIRNVILDGDAEFVEIGAGKVLTRLVQQIRADPASQSQSQPYRSRHCRRYVAAPSAPVVPQAKLEPSAPRSLHPRQLGHSDYLRDHRVKYAYAAGSMYRGIASADMVIQLGRHGMLGYLGAGGLSLEEIEAALRKIQGALSQGQAFGVNLLENVHQPEIVDKTVDLFLRLGVTRVEASSFIGMTAPVVRYRLQGLRQGADGVEIRHKIMGKVSRPETAACFLAPAPSHIVEKLLREGKVTSEQARLAAHVPMADDLCAEADSGGHTDKRVASTLLPAFVQLRDELARQHGYRSLPRIGAAGGLGTPQAMAAAFLMGADFVVTGSINQCTPEAGTSDLVKDMLAAADVQDTDMAPAGDMFEMGTKVQVLKKGTLFAARANKLAELYRQHGCWSDIDPATREQIEQKYFKRTHADVLEETKAYLRRVSPQRLAGVEADRKAQLAAVFRWYLGQTASFALRGDAGQKANFQVHVGPAMGAFNRWVKGTPYSDWRRRHVHEIGELLMRETAAVLTRHVEQAQRLMSQAQHADAAAVQEAQA